MAETTGTKIYEVTVNQTRLMAWRVMSIILTYLFMVYNEKFMIHVLNSTEYTKILAVWNEMECNVKRKTSKLSYKMVFGMDKEELEKGNLDSSFSVINCYSDDIGPILIKTKELMADVINGFVVYSEDNKGNNTDFIGNLYGIEPVYKFRHYILNVKDSTINMAKKMQGQTGLHIISSSTPQLGDILSYNLGMDFGISISSFQGINSRKPSRNEPCPCGSNKKYNHCHNR